MSKLLATNLPVKVAFFASIFITSPIHGLQNQRLMKKPKTFGQNMLKKAIGE